jgi:hypothetical protein
MKVAFVRFVAMVLLCLRSTAPFGQKSDPVLLLSRPVICLGIIVIPKYVKCEKCHGCLAFSRLQEGVAVSCHSEVASEVAWRHVGTRLPKSIFDFTPQTYKNKDLQHRDHDGTPTPLQ